MDGRCRSCRRVLRLRRGHAPAAAAATRGAARLASSAAARRASTHLSTAVDAAGPTPTQHTVAITTRGLAVPAARASTAAQRTARPLPSTPTRAAAGPLVAPGPTSALVTPAGAASSAAAVATAATCTLLRHAAAGRPGVADLAGWLRLRWSRQ